jgi:hypothetical protein
MDNERTYEADTPPEWLTGRVAVNDEGCWIWLGPVTTSGYGQGLVRGRDNHRVVYERLVGPIGPGLVLDHVCHSRAVCSGGHCRHRRCLCWAHLVPRSPGSNVAASVNSVQIQRRLRSSCGRGHPYNAANVYWERRGSSAIRHCRTCRKESGGRRRQRDSPAGNVSRPDPARGVIEPELNEQGDEGLPTTT